MINFFKNLFRSKALKKAIQISKEIKEFERDVLYINKEHRLQQKNPFNIDGKEPEKYLNKLKKIRGFKRRKKAYIKFYQSSAYSLMKTKGRFGISNRAKPFENKLNILGTSLYNDRVSELYERQVNSSIRQNAVISEIDFFTRKLEDVARKAGVPVQELINKFNEARVRNKNLSNSPYDLPYDLELKDLDK